MLDWVYRAIERHLRRKPSRLAACLPYIPRWLVERVARAKLVRTLRHVWDHSPVQRELWRAAGVTRRDLRSTDVLPRIPFFDLTPARESPESCFCVPERELTHLLTTAGTTGRRKNIYMTNEDMEQQTRIMGMRLVALPGASRVLVLFSVATSTWTAGPMSQRAIEKGNLFGIVCDQDRPPAEQIDFIRRHRIDTLIGAMTTLQRLTLEADCDLKSLGVKYILLSAQPWPESMRRQIEEAWGATVIDVYGLMEFGSGVASECVEQNGLHIAATDFRVEIVDPETGTLLPDGEYGEIVLTTLTRRGMPLVRYRTHDLACLLPETRRCPCGMPTRRLSRVRGRLDHVIIAGAGGKFYPDDFDRVLLGVPGVSDYQLTIDRQGYRDVLSVTVESDEPVETLAPRLTEALFTLKFLRRSCVERDTMALGEFRTVSRGTLSAGRPKSLRIVDRRKMVDEAPPAP
ncbi:MAG TPA: AMP-binding protein [Planctomycetota bacterium]|nr:AMP-binding protein [Planctomycetota bacterium]